MNGQPLTAKQHEDLPNIPGSVFFNTQYGAQGNSTTIAVATGNGTSKINGLWSFRLEKNA